MARGDVIQLNHTQNATGYQTLVPASGDEWLIIKVAPTGSLQYFSFSMTSDSGSNWYGMAGGGASGRADYAGWCWDHVKWYLTPTCHIRVYRSTATFWHFTAVKWKD